MISNSNTFARLTRLAGFALLVAPLCACGQAASGRPSAATASGDGDTAIARHDFRNGPFPTTCGSPDGRPRELTLLDGRYSAPDSDDVGTMFDVRRVDFGDVTGDGRPDAVVTATCDDFGTAPPLATVVVFIDRDGTIEPVAHLDAGVWDESEVATIDGGQLALSFVQVEEHGPEEGGRTRRIYRWDGSQLVESSPR